MRISIVGNNKLSRDVNKYRNILVMIIFVSTVIRAFLAATLELGNDEVYYWTYALYPDLSHFDHPPMVGFLIQLTTLNLHFDSELFIRLGSVMFGGVNTWLIYMLAKFVKDETAGIHAALLYNASVYCFVIAGVMILPDTPQLFFWLISLYLLLYVFTQKEVSRKSKIILLLAGVTIGLGMLSKYTTVFLWVGACLYILLYDRTWLRKKELYLAVMITLVVFSPVTAWNIKNHLISFTYHGERVSLFDSGLRADTFFTELAGHILYNNPVSFVIILLALLSLRKMKFIPLPVHSRLLLLTSLPMIFLFLLFALFRPTLPHWTGPGYLGLIVIAAAWLSYRDNQHPVKKTFPWPLRVSTGLLLVVVIFGYLQINCGIINFTSGNKPDDLGSDDVTLDMYGWRQFAGEFRQLAEKDFSSGNMSQDAPILSHRWFPAAHLDYYVAHPLGIDVLAFGSLERIHKYAWINRGRKPLEIGSDAWYITNSRDFHDPAPLFGGNFANIEEPVIIPIYRRSVRVENFFVYHLRNCIALPDNVL